jgi:hypothetical protein
MEPIMQESRTSSLVQLPYLLPMFVVVAIFTAVYAGARMLAGDTAAPFNPFAPYADVFPGQPRSAVVDRGFSCPSVRDYDTYQDTSEETCIFRPESDPFFDVQVVLSSDSIHQIMFAIHDNRLRVGNLIALWGKPEVQVKSHLVYLFWRSRKINALAPRDTGRFSLFLPVWKVYFFNG